MLNLTAVLRPGGYTRSAWRLPASQIQRGTQLGFYTEIAQAAENAAIDALFCADALNLPGDPWDALAQPLEPMSLLSALAGRTSAIGLIGTFSTTYSQPYNLARQLATLDHVSEGRAGWNVVTSADPSAAANFSTSEHMDHALRYQRAGEFVEVAQKLWDSWQDGAVVLDRANGVMTDPDKTRPIDHHGQFFDVRGPLNVPRTPQGRPVLAHAGQSKDALPVGSKYAEVWFTVQFDLAVAQQSYRQIKQLVAGHGRAPEHCRVLPGLTPIIGSTEEEAQRLAEQLRELGGRDEKDAEISGMVGYDISAADPDSVLDISQINSPEHNLGPQSWPTLLFRVLTAKPMTVREARATFDAVGRSGHLQVVGTPEQVADTMEAWYRGEAADGFTIMSASLPGDAITFFEQVVPILRKRGLFRTEYSGSTLRDHLGLPVPS